MPDSHEGTIIMTTHNATPVEEASVELKDAINWAAGIANTCRAYLRYPL